MSKRGRRRTKEEESPAEEEKVAVAAPAEVTEAAPVADPSPNKKAREERQWCYLMPRQEYAAVIRSSSHSEPPPADAGADASYMRMRAWAERAKGAGYRVDLVRYVTMTSE